MTGTRFGMFITFGLYSIPGGVWRGKQMGRNLYAEWIRAQWGWPRPGCGIPKEDYDTLLGRFNPTRFDAEEWIGLAAAAGMKYFVITAKHHDGFALWDSAVSRYSVAATPFGETGRDLLGELNAACRRRGVRFGLYYSHWQDWEHPGGARPPWPEAEGDPPVEQPSDEEFERYWREKSLPQVAELIERYDPEMLWFDTWARGAARQITPRRRDELLRLVREKAPGCLVNGRIAAHDPAGADFVSMMDNEYPGADEAPDVPWETPATMNHSWGYHRLDYGWKSFGSLLTRLITNAHHGGGMTLNVGPLPDGSFPRAARHRLRQFAAWMEVNGPAIQPTARSPFDDGALPAWLRSTFCPERRVVYLLFLPPFETGEVALPRPSCFEGIAVSRLRARVIETGEVIRVEDARGGMLRLVTPERMDSLDYPVVELGPEGEVRCEDEDGRPSAQAERAEFSPELIP